MQTQEIPRQEWNSFFDTFSRRHEGWLATLEVFGFDVGAQEEAHELPLEGVSIASEADKSEGIAINMRDRERLKLRMPRQTRRSASGAAPVIGRGISETVAAE